MYFFFRNLILILFNLMLCLCLKQNDQNLLPKSDWFMNEIFKEFSSRNDSISLTEIQNLIDDLRSTPSSDNYKSFGFHRCYSAEELFSIFEFDELINKKNFTKLSSSLLLLAIEKECKEIKKNEEIINNVGNNTTKVDCKSSTRQKFLFGSLTIIFTWITSLVFLFTTSRFSTHKKWIILILNALAIGTLIGDAFMHIIPTALGIGCNHGSGKNKDHHPDEMDVIWKMFAILASVFLLMLLDFFGGHSHGQAESDCHKMHEFELANDNSEKLNKSEKLIQFLPNKTEKNKKRFSELLQGTSLIIILANFIHKCADGLVIGAAFSESLSLGFSTAFALLFHEIPHELGDYGMLSSHGFKYWQIMITSSIGSLISLCTLLIISAIKPDSAVREWIFAITAGVFIYIALVAMTPAIKGVFKKKKGRRNWLSIILVVIGFWVGIVFMLLIAIYEDDIRVDVTSFCGT